MNGHFMYDPTENIEMLPAIGGPSHGQLLGHYTDRTYKDQPTPCYRLEKWFAFGQVLVWSELSESEAVTLGRQLLESY